MKKRRRKPLYFLEFDMTVGASSPRVDQLMRQDESAVSTVRSTRELPDIANRTNAALHGALDRVGMGHIEVPVRILGPEGDLQVQSALADAYVNLADPTAKGIHMSRLFLSLQEGLEMDVLSFDLIDRVLGSFLESHTDLSDEAYLSVRLDWMAKRDALVSNNAGWRTYPVQLSGQIKDGKVRFFLGSKITYSSTCPCSAALARQLIQEAFARDFSSQTKVDVSDVLSWLGQESAICATPHSQRSEAHVLVEVDAGKRDLTIAQLIDGVEHSLQTVVQAAVKREDEQAFALLNGQNLMFCEDAARRVRNFLDTDGRVVDYRVECSHYESLHPHNAVSVVVKGVPGGMAA
jgi:GTP cyclohydrolase I